MRFAYTALAAWGGLVSAVPQNAAAGCTPSYGGSFEITIATATSQKREVQQFEASIPTPLPDVAAAADGRGRSARAVGATASSS